MKKLSVVVLVSLLVNMVAYAAGWESDGTKLFASPISTNVGIGTSDPGNIKCYIKGSHVSGIGMMMLEGYNHAYMSFKARSGYDAGFCIWEGEERKWLVGYENYDSRFRFRSDDFGEDILTITNYGSVGIGTTDPETKLHIKGSHVPGIGLLELEGNNSNHAYMTLRAASGKDAGIKIFEGEDAKWIISYDDYDSRFRFHSYDFGEDILVITNDGEVGIGTDDPQSKLAVNGTITAKEVIVTADGWSDFVFENNYKLMPLDKLENHIKKEKSLPGIPTEKEVLENGAKLGDMQAKLLEKVEELTLYVIELKKENIELKKTNEDLENRISILER